MTGAQLKRALKRVGLTQRVFARAIDISERQVRRWVAGDSPVPRVVQYALLWVCRHRATYFANRARR